MTPIIIHTSGTSNNAFRMSDINTLGVIDQRRSTILICEALDQLLSALSSLARALKTLIQGSSRTLGNESEGLNVDSNQVLAQRERKNLPDLLLGKGNYDFAVFFCLPQCYVKLNRNISIIRGS